MQTTLLGFAFAIILALVTALVGPLFVDWSSYRGEFEARATRLTGLDFRVSGAIDARLLPTPSIMLHGVEFGRPNEASKVSARGLRLEFALGALMRGEWRIAEARLEGPELAAGLDSSGHIAWPLPRLGFDLEGVSVERLQIEDGRAVLADAASDTRVTLENVEFRGEMRSLGGPVKGDGSFVVSGRRYPYRISTGRIAEDGGVKVRLSVESAQPPLTTDADVTIWTEQGTPRFEGSVQMVRPVGRAPAGAQALIIDAWRVTSRIKGDSTAALLDQIEFQYGPDDRAIKLRGNANLTFGPRPEITGVLSSPQIDLDRVLALPDATRRQPPTAIKTMAENLVPMAQLPVPTTLSVAVESVTLAGTMLTRVNVEMKSDADGLELKALDLRAPGATQLHLSGRLGTTPAGIQFQGSTQVEANDPRAFVAWLTERTEEQSAGAGPWRLAGDVTLGSDAIAIERMKLELDRMTVAGRVAYAWTVEDRPARLDAALTATEIDLDRVQLLAKGMLGGAAFDWPREGALSLKIGRGFIAGVEAKQADVNVKFGATGLAIEQLAVADFGGAALAVKGRIGTNAQAPRGALTLDLDARALDGVTAALEKFAPQTADRLRRSAARLTPLVLRATLAVDPSATGAAAANGKFKIVGRAGAFRVALDGDAGAAADALKLDNLAALAGAKVNVSGRLDGDDGAALIELMGLDRFVVADKRPGRLTLTAKGPLDGELAIDGQLAAGSLNIATNGTLRLAGSASPSAALNLKVANANLRSPRPAAAGRGPEVLPTSANARLTWTDGILGFSGITGTMAGTTIGGRVAIGLQQQPITIDGDLDAGAVDLPAAIAVALGLPAQSVGTTAAASGGALGSWPSEPFEALPRLSGQVAVKSARVKLTPKLAARDVRAVVRFGESELALQAVEGSIAGGKLGAELALSHRPEGLAARASVQLAGVNAAELLPGDGVVTGKLTLDAKVEGSGLSAVALMGSLAGDGTFKLENGRVVRLDPAAFETVMRAVDQGLPIDATRIRDRMDAALASGVLSVALAEGAISVNAGQARLSDVTARAQRADVAVSGSVNLADAALEGRLTLSGMGGTNAPANTRPEITIGLKGPVDTPKRSIDVAALSSWLALRAVEQQSKKLEALEGRAPATAATANANPRTGPTQPALATDAAVPAALHTEPDAADPQPVARPQPATPKAQKPKPAVPTAERAPTLPPPIDVRPAPTPPAPRAAAHGAASQPQPQKPVAAPAPPRQRSWSEILFGN